MECRTCLVAGVKLYDLKDTFSAGDAQQKDVSYLDCLLFCTRFKNKTSFPNYICVECSRALKIAYIFIQNAVKAHEILIQRTKMLDGMSGDVEIQKEQSIGMKFRCKICQEKLASKKDLKDHIKLHMDVITYRCQLCDFDCKKRTHLADHYSYEHNTEATSDQLMPLMQQTSDYNEISEEHIKQENVEKDTLLARLEERKKQEEEAELLLQELEERMLRENQEENIIGEKQEILNNLTDELMSEDNFQTDVALEFTNTELDAITLPVMQSNNEIALGNEFLVMPDGTLQKIDGANIVIQYVDNEVNIGGVSGDVPILDGNDLIVDNIVQIDATNDTEISSMEIADVLEDATNDNPSSSSKILMNTYQTESQNNESQIALDDQSNLTSNTSSEAKQNHCKICNQIFDTQSELKIHMLGHAEIPHFFCDRCSFYTFFKNDLTQHYKTIHKLHPSSSQLKPKNKINKVTGKTIYSCDLCFFETSIRLTLFQHYTNVHKVEPNEVQMRPTIDKTDLNMPYIKLNSDNKTQKRVTNIGRKNRITCKLCKQVFQSPSDYREHLLWHKKEKKKEAIIRLLQVEDENDLKINNTNNPQYMETQTESTIKTTTTTNIIETNTTNQDQNNVSNYEFNYANIENNVILPMEAIPQIIASEQTIETKGINFNFNSDEIFEDFDNGNDSVNENDGDEDELGNLVLTSEDDLDDLIEEHGSDDRISCSGKSHTGKSQLNAYCVHCNKRFFSQYHFENHMFIHRGLAPYRCEMCTNIYNTKRSLIKHYKAIHKRLPTRDMIQAKGDKVNATEFSINSEETKVGTLMCAKCPFESTELLNLQQHLNVAHDITDQNYVLKKLPFECPRCVRSYDTKARLLRHLERNHSTQSIFQQSIFESKAKNAINITTNIPIKSHTIPSGQQTVDSTTTKIKQSIIPENQTGISTSGKQQSILSLESEPSLWHQPEDDFNNLKVIGEQPTSSTMTTPETSPTINSFICNICYGKYKSETLLKFHMKRHLERNFRCEVCPKSFITRSDLLKHKTLHTGNLRFECDFCDKKFGYSHHLKRHRETLHLNKRFLCPMMICGKKFSTQTQLKQHMREHNGGYPFKCPYCERPFNRREYLRQHARKIHKITLTEEEIAEIFRATNGYTNPYDFIVAKNGKYVRRSDVEGPAVAVPNIKNDQVYDMEEEIITEEIDFKLSE